MDEAISHKHTKKKGALKIVLASLLVTFLAGFFFTAGILAYIRIGLNGDEFASLLRTRLGRLTNISVSFASADVVWLDRTNARVFIKNIAFSCPNLCEGSVDQIVAEIDAVKLIGRNLYLEILELHNPSITLNEENPGVSARDSKSISQFGIHIAKAKCISGKFNVNVPGGTTITAIENIFIDAINISAAGVEKFSLKGLPLGEEINGTIAVSGSYFHAPTPIFGFDLLAQRIPIEFLNRMLSLSKIDSGILGGNMNAAIKCSGKYDDFSIHGQLSLDGTHLIPGERFLDRVSLEKSSIGFRLDKSGNKVSAEFSELKIPGAQASFKLELDDLWKKDARLKLDLTSAELDLRNLFRFVPMNMFDATDRDKILDAGLKGRVVITGGSWAGPLGSLFSPSAPKGLVFIDAYLDRISGFVPGAGLRISDATGRLRLSAEELLFNGISFTLGNSPIVLNGWITDIKNKPKTDLFLSMTAQVADLKPILESSYIPSHYRDWIVQLSDPSGGISVNLDVKGDLYAPSMKGKVVIDDFGCKLVGRPFPLRKVNGSLRFRSNGISAVELKGFMGEGPFELTGELLPNDINLNCELKINGSDLKKAQILPFNTAISGSLPISVSIKGNMNLLNFALKTDLKNNAVEHGKIIRKKLGTPLVVEVTGNKGKSGFSIDEASLIFNDTRISSRATIGTDGRHSIVVNLPPRGIPSNVLIPYLDPYLEVQPGGRIEGDLSFRTSDKSRDWFTEANIVCSYLSMKIPGFYKRTEGLTGSYKKKGMQTSINVERAKIGNSVYSAVINYQDAEKPKLEINFDYQFLDITDFTAPPNYVSDVTWGEWIKSSPIIRIMAKSKCSGAVKAAKGKTAAYTFSDFKSSFEGVNGLISVPHWQMNFAEGLVRGTAEYDIRETTTKPFSVRFQGDGLKLDRLIKTESDQVKFEGAVHLDGDLEWKLTSKRDNHGIYKTGKTHVRIQEGTIHKFEVLSKIFSLINLGSLMRGKLPDIAASGLPFQKITWNMEVFDNKWKIKDLRISSDAAAIDSTGMYFSSQNRVDFKVNVSPLVGFDTLVSGLFGNLITKDGKLLTTTFRVRGLYTSPDVRLEPFENIRADELNRN